MKRRGGSRGSHDSACWRPSFPSASLTLLTLTAFPSILWSQQTSTIQGIVMDSTRTGEESGGVAPLIGARLEVAGVEAEARTDARGRFRLTVPGPGTYRLTFHHPRLDTVGIEAMGWTPVTVTEEEGDGRVELAVPSWPTLYGGWCGRDPRADPVDVIVAGRVRNALDGRPLPDVATELRPVDDRGGAQSLAGQTAEDGLVLFCSVPPGVGHRLVANAFGLEDASSEIRGAAGDIVERELEFEIGGEGSLRGVVRQGGEDGAPVGGAVVELQGAGSHSALTDAEGRFRMDELEAGRYQLGVSHLAYRDVSREVGLPGGGRVMNVEVRMLPDAIALEPVVVEVEGSRRPTWGPLVDVYDRMDRMRKLGLGRIFDRQEIVQSGVMRISHLVARSAGVRSRPIPGSPNLEILLNHRRCGPSVYIDGIRGAGRIDDVSVLDVEVVEVYRRMSQLPGEFWDQNSAYCGAVVIWTRRGGDP